ncbi:MAG: tRNA (N6-isopentenyl adenosine(37)-C2)-methylthiotransferase MiaB [Chloroflexi bacterium RBG_16_68_14]|nr:MAG: tRNA (N6-isopentenyl adenosine(37)-C2)-methylthiotransferase MiaB [Chloroflexi bacterium RBG_16_68_14]
MRYHIWTVGCQMNKADSQKLAAGLDRLGWSQVARPEEADLVVLNTCSVRDHAEQRAVSKLGTLKKLRGRGKELKIAVMGCLVGLKTDELRRRFPYVDAFARPQQFEPIMEVAGYEDLGGEFWPTTFAVPEGPTAYVPIIHGCDKFCTYCIVPYRRGRERSRTIDDIRMEVAHLAARACAEQGRRGVREVTLLGQTVEAYGHDLPPDPATGRPPDLADLLRALHDIEGIERLRFLTSYPKDMTERIIDAVAELPKVCKYFNIPVQSGDNAVLTRMRRGYTIEEYLEKVDLIRRRVPDVAITTDVIVGFCGETEEEFRRTYELVERLEFDKVHVAAYSPRPGTIAYRKLADDVPHEVKMARLHAIEQLEAQISARINSRLLGREVEVLVEGQGKKVGAVRELPPQTGRTRQNKLVHFVGDAAVGQLATVRIERTSPWSLVGTATT